MLWVKALTVPQEESRITLGLPWRKKDEQPHADISNDFYTGKLSQVVKIVQFRVPYDRWIKEVKTHFLQA